MVVNVAYSHTRHMCVFANFQTSCAEIFQFRKCIFTD